jgi:DNA-binding beta-propeller fold protein YncE
MKKEWYISFHGGAERRELNNIHVYSLDGRKVRKALDEDSIPENVELRELRGYAFGPDGDLYIANAFRDYSQVLRFSRKLDRHGQHNFREVFVKSHPARNPGLSHPFSLAFHRNGNLYVTSQNTSLVLRYHGPDSTPGLPGTPMPLPPALAKITSAPFPPGTFCASAKQASYGLTVVREATFANRLLFVADRGADCVNKFDPVTGAYRGRLVAHGLIDKPIHLAASGDALYIGNRGNESVVKCDLRTERISPFIAPRAGGLKNPSGLAFGDDGYLYVASRSSRQILRYRLENGAPARRPFIDNLQDEPQFIEPVTRR